MPHCVSGGSVHLVQVCAARRAVVSEVCVPSAAAVLCVLCFGGVLHFILLFKIDCIDYAITVVPFHPLHSPPPCTPPLTHIPPYSSCPWVILISSLAPTFPTLFLPSPCLVSTYHLCYLFSVPSPPLSLSQSPIDNPPCDLHFCGSVPDLVVCLLFFCFGFRCGC